MRLLKVSGRPLPKAMSISRSEILRKRPEKEKVIGGHGSSMDGHRRSVEGQGRSTRG